MSKLKEVLAIANNKGGVGKTTTVRNLAAGLLRVHPKYKILCIDLDPQCNLSSLMGWHEIQAKQEKILNVADALRDGDNNHLPVYRCENGLYLCPGSDKLEYIDTDLNRQISSNQVLSSLFGNPLDLNDSDKECYLEDEFDYVLIDCPPALGELTYNALAAASGVIIPLQLAALSVDGLGRMIDAVKQVKQKLNSDLDLRGLLICMAKDNQVVAKETTEYLRSTYEDMIFQTRIRSCAEVEKAQYIPTDIFTYNAKCAAAQDYAALVHELLK